jgi:acyl-coenzyme A thioesterase PaaI-like protein
VIQREAVTTPPEIEPLALVDALRTLIETVRLTDAPAEALEGARCLIDAANGELASFRHTGQIAQGALNGDGIKLRSAWLGSPNEFFPYSPIVGPLNPVAPPVRMWADDAKHVHGEVVLDAPYVGPPGLVHGGVIALIFDELLGAAAVINECPGFTGTLTVKYLRGTPVRTTLTMEAFVERVEGRKTFVTGEIRNGDVVTASATGIFIATETQQPRQ